MQYINFYLEEFRPKPLSFDIKFSAAVIGVVVLGLIAIGIVQQQRLSERKAIQFAKQEQVDKLILQVNELQQSLKNNRQFQDIENQHAYLKGQLTQYQKAISALAIPDEKTFDPLQSNIIRSKPKKS